MVRRLFWPGLATLIALGILVSLGTWQLLRMQEKAAMLARLETAVNATPRSIDGREALDLIVLPAHRSDSPAISELTRVSLSGRYLSKGSIPVRGTLPATKGAAVSGLGFFWMTPMEIEGGIIVFVNRGFVPSGGDWKPPALPVPEGLQTVTGLIRLAEKPRWFTPPDNPAKGEYFSRDPSVMAGFLGLPKAQVAPFFVDAERTGGSLTPPTGVDAREMIARIPNNHLQYAVTWFVFAATLLGVFGFFAHARLKEDA